MSGTQVQAGSPNTDFLKGLDLIIDSLVDKQFSSLPLAPKGASAGGIMDSDDAEPEDTTDSTEEEENPEEEGGAVEKINTTNAGENSYYSAPSKKEFETGHASMSGEKSEKAGLEKIGPAAAALAGAAAEPLVSAAADRIRGGKTDKSHVKDATDLGDKTNLPPEMGRREEGSSIAEPMLRRREVRKANLNAMQRGIDLFKMMATVDRTIEKFDGTKDRISDVQILKAFGLCECTKTEDIKEGTLIHKMLIDRGSRPSTEWWEGCIAFAKSFKDVDEPAFFATFLYYKPDMFRPDSFMKGLNDTGGQVKHGRAMSRDTEIDENIGAMGGGAIDGLGMSDDDDADVEKNHHDHKS